MIPCVNTRFRHLATAATATVIVCAIFSQALADDASSVQIPATLDNLTYEDACAWVRPVLHAEPTTLNRYISNKDDTIALVASWERLRRSQVLQVAQGRRHVVIPKHELVRFEGFVEGRLRTNIPTDWHKALGTVRVKENETGEVAIWFDLGLSRVYDGWTVPNEELPPWYRVADDGEFRTSANVATARSLNDELEVVHADGTKYIFGSDVMATLRRSIGGRSGYLTMQSSDKLQFLALVAAFGDEVVLACVDKANGELKWQHSLWPATVGIRGGGYQGPQFVELCLCDSDVLVFGAGHQNLYIERLDAISGELRLRFGTYYWRPWAKGPGGGILSD